MNKLTASILLLLISIPGLFAQENTGQAVAIPEASVERNFYLTPKFYLVFADSDAIDFDTTGGIGLAFGYQFGPDKQIAVEGEIGYAGWETDYGFYYTYVEDDLNVYPFLLTLKWNPKLSDKLRFSIGPTVGFTYIHRKIYEYNYWYWQSHSDDSWEFTYGGTASITYAFSERLALEVAYRFILVDADSETRVHLPSVGLSLSF